MSVKKPAHRPTKYTKELADEICRRRTTDTLLQICKADDMPSRKVVHEWLLDDDKKYFRDNYEFSSNLFFDGLSEEIFDIADDGTNDYQEVVNARAGGLDDEDCAESTITKLNPENIQRSRLRTDVRKWYLSKVLPKKFGDKMDLTSGGKPIPILGNINALPKNNSNSEDTEIEEED